MNRRTYVWIPIVFCLLFLNGCSLIPRINFDTPNTVPQAVDKNKAKEICKGKATFNEMGEITSCSVGYYKYAENYNKKERKMTLAERIKSIINGLVGWSFWIVLALVFLCPSLLGAIAGRIIEATVGITGKALRATVRGVQQARKNGTDLNTALASEQDSDVKDYVAKIKKQEKIK